MSRICMGSGRNQQDMVPPPLRRIETAARASSRMTTVPRISESSMSHLLEHEGYAFSVHQLWTPVKEKDGAPGRRKLRHGPVARRAQRRRAAENGSERRAVCDRRALRKSAMPIVPRVILLFVCRRRGRRQAREKAFSLTFLFRRSAGEEKRNRVPPACGARFRGCRKEGIRQIAGERFPRCMFLRSTERCSGSRCRRRGFRRSRRRRDRRRGRRRHCPPRRW